MKVIQYIKVILVFAILSNCKSYVITGQESDTRAVEASETATNTELVEVIAPYKDSMEASMKQVIGVSELEMTTGSPEGLLGNYICDLSLEIGNELYKKNENSQADFVLLNNGGFRTSMPKGDVTLGKVYEIMPFENELVVVTLSIKNTVELLNYIGRKTVKNGNRKQGVPVSGNMYVELRDQTPIEALVDSARLRGRPYKVITTDYLANGGDNMSFFLNPIKKEKLGIKLRDAIILDIKRKTEVGKMISSKLDNRIVYVD